MARMEEGGSLWDIEPSNNAGFPWQLQQAAKRAAFKAYVRLDWPDSVAEPANEQSNTLSLQPITVLPEHHIPFSHFFQLFY